MRPRQLLAPLVVLLSLLGFGAVVAPGALAAPTTTTTGWVRLANLSAGSPAVDIYLLAFGDSANPTVLTHQTYGEVSSYMPIAAGQYTVAIRPVGASASTPPTVSVNFMVSEGTNYTVASLGPANGRRLEVLKDDMAAPSGQALVRVIQASLKQNQVTVSLGGNTLASQLAFGSVTSYMSVKPGSQTVQVSAAGMKTDSSVTLTSGSVHTVVILDTSTGLKVDPLTDAAGSTNDPKGGAATGFGGTAPLPPAQTAQWLAALAGGLVLMAAGTIGLRRSRRATVARP
jgi:Domain of unknown function (DUF4397)